VLRLDFSGGNQLVHFLFHELKTGSSTEDGQYAFPMVSAPREFAALFLVRQEQPGDFAERRLEKDRVFTGLKPTDRRLAQELVLGVLRWRRTLDDLIAGRTDGRTIPPVPRTLLRLGIYQLLWLDRIPDHAAVHDSVELARRLGFPAQAGFVNAVLRNVIRDREATRQRLEQLQRTDPARGWSLPSWLISRWAARYSPDELQTLCRRVNTPPPLFARVNRLKTTPEEILSRWDSEGILHQERIVDWADPGSVQELSGIAAVSDLGSFLDGGFYVQDPSTLLAVRELDPRPGESILDLCAAPGGKTLYIAERLGNAGQIAAHDTSEGRLALLRGNALRLGVTCVSVLSTLPTPAPDFDGILVDAPCSNTGVLRRRVELRWRLDPGEFQRMAAVQLGLLTDAAQRIRPGGRIVYSTCSLEPEENGEVVTRFLASHPGFTVETQRTLDPVRDGVDGAFVARLRAPGSSGPRGSGTQDTV
jgi:16S rRNA (cytosine967-C5)-methyltransferase